jgi:L-threonate 2-dehydrogenase
MKIGAFGPGCMGFGMATSLIRSGHEVYGADINPASVARLCGESGSPLAAMSALPELDAVMVVVLSGAQGEDVFFGEWGVVERLAAEVVVILCVTVAPAYARSVAKRCAARGIDFLDAPIFGRSVKAAQGKLSIMASGHPNAFRNTRSALDAMAETVFELGDDAGAGSAMKAVNLMLAGVHIAPMVEAFTFGMTQGIALETFMKVIPRCAGTSWMLENREPHIVECDYTPRSAVDIWPKDLGIVLDAARTSKFAAPVTAAALQQFLAASGMELGREEDAAVAKVCARNSGLKLPGTDET